MEKSYLRLLLGRLLILIEVEMATLVEVDSVERPEGVVMVGMEKMDRVEREDEAPALMSEHLEVRS